jgi:transcriptional regulator with XRE-family HTH domain
MTIGDKIKKVRLERGWTQTDLANRLGFNACQISFYESGKREPNFKNFIKLCEALGCTPNDLLGWDKESTICTNCNGAGIIWRKK